MRKIFSFAIILFASFIFFVPKSLAAEFELVSYSSNVKLQWLADIGEPDAQKISKVLGKVDIYGRRNLRDYDRLRVINGIYQEICYLATVQYVQQNDYKNIFDLGGGYTPRAVVFAREGRKYFSGELMAVAVSADNVMKKILTPEQKKFVTYDEVLVEDKDKFMEVSNTLPGKICVVEQGLMIYLNQDRLVKMCENIDAMLRKNGGCFITSDPSTRSLFKNIADALYGENQTPLLYDETKDMYEELFDSLINEETFDYQLDVIEYAENYLHWNIQRVPLLSDASKLHCLKNLTPEQAEKIKEIAKNKYLWVITTK